MNHFFIEFKDGTLILNDGIISIFAENDFIDDTKEITLNKIDYNGFTTYYLPVFLENFLFQLSITFFQEKNIDQSFHLIWLNCETHNHGYHTDELMIIRDIDKLKIFMSRFFNCIFQKIDEHTFEYVSGWGRIILGGSLKTPNVGISVIYE